MTIDAPERALDSRGGFGLISVSSGSAHQQPAASPVLCLQGDSAGGCASATIVSNCARMALYQSKSSA